MQFASHGAFSLGKLQSIVFLLKIRYGSYRAEQVSVPPAKK